MFTVKRGREEEDQEEEGRNSSSSKEARTAPTRPEEEDQEVEGINSSSSREARPVLIRKPPNGPTEEEIRKHDVTHYPPRSWCPFCVSGRFKNWPHLRRPKGEVRMYPEVSFDYGFIRKCKGGRTIPVLVGRDRQSQVLIAHVVPYKGAGTPWLIDQLVRDLNKIGASGRVVLKGDPENAVGDVLQSVARARGVDGNGAHLTTVERSQKEESQTNGVAERAVQEVEEGLQQAAALRSDEDREEPTHSGFDDP